MERQGISLERGVPPLVDHERAEAALDEQDRRRETRRSRPDNENVRFLLPFHWPPPGGESLHRLRQCLGAFAVRAPPHAEHDAGE